MADECNKEGVVIIPPIYPDPEGCDCNIIAGDGIAVEETAEGTKISATGGGESYSAGENIDITDGVISVPDVYTKNETDALIDAIVTGEFKVVDELPEEGTPKTIYLLPKEGGGYSEWLYVDGWEEIGDTDIDLTGYYTKTEADAKFATADALASVESKANTAQTDATTALASAATALDAAEEAKTIANSKLSCDDLANCETIIDLQTGKQDTLTKQDVLDLLGYDEIEISTTDTEGQTITAHVLGWAETIYAVRFEGVEDATINQGAEFNLTDGVHAYLGEEELAYTVTPDTIDTCAVGAKVFTYTAEDKSVTRTITVEAADDPTITGTDDVTIAPGTEFNPLEGVTATDAYGNELTVTVSEPQNRRYEYSYIKSYGQEYIDTGLKLNANSRIVADVQFTTSNTLSGFTGDRTDTTAMLGFGTQPTRYVAYYGNRAGNAVPTSGSNTDRATVELDKNLLKVNGTILAVVQSTVSEFETGGNCYIFAINGLPNYKSVAKLYSYKLYDGDTLLLDLIPYEKNGEIGLQDKLTGTFYGNQGDGTLTGGGSTEKYELIYTATDECGNETTVTRTVTIQEPPYQTYVVQDGDYTTLFVNATEDDLDSVFGTTGEVIATYPALGYGHNYEFSSADDVLWAEYRDQINDVAAANEIQPTKMDYWFYGTTLYNDPFTFNENLDLSNCTSMAHTFENATIQGNRLVYVWDVSHVTNMQGMFELCSISVDALALADWNTSNVTNMREMFYGCQAGSLWLDHWNTSNVTDFTDMFSQMENLETIYASEAFTIGDFEGDMFTDDTLLVGGAGTTYIDGSSVYARIDTEEAHGYFTAEA